MSMTKTERNELRRVVKARFEILKTQLMRREAALRRAVERHLLEERKALLERYEKRVHKFYEKVRKLNDEAEQLRLDATREGLSVGKHYSNSDNVVTYIEPPRLMGASEIVSERVEKIRDAATLSRSDLELRELQLMEDLAIGALETETARDFMASIPGVDDVLPLPEEYRKEIEA